MVEIGVQWAIIKLGGVFAYLQPDSIKRSVWTAASSTSPPTSVKLGPPPQPTLVLSASLTARTPTAPECGWRLRDGEIAMWPPALPIRWRIPTTANYGAVSPQPPV